MTTPNGTINLPLALVATLNHGVDIASGRRIGPDVGGLEEYQTFDDLCAAYRRQVEFHIERLAESQRLIYEVSAEELGFPLVSLGYATCLERGLGFINGGIDHLGGTLETYGNITAADSLNALRTVYFRERACPAATLLQALREDFRGHEALRRRLVAVPKFGNDDDEADQLAAELHDHVCEHTRAQAERVGLRSYLVVVINNGFHVIFGTSTGATPDGRGAGMALSNGNAPTAGNDRNGLTACFNSILRLRADHHAGAVHNVVVTRRLLDRDRDRFRPLFDSYFAGGGTQLMLTPVDRGMLQDAAQHPERHPNLLVRMGGYSARFVELGPEHQRDIMARTLNE
jgi:pyruvate-formate lyase